MKKTLRYLKKLSDEFRAAYKSKMLHNLLRSNIWNTEEENVSLGDIVLVEFNSMLNNVYRMGRVTKYKDGAKTARVKFKIQKTARWRIIKSAQDN